MSTDKTGTGPDSAASKTSKAKNKKPKNKKSKK